MKILVTGGAGFIGSALIRKIISETNYIVINIDKLTYAADLNSLKTVQNDSNYYFEQVDICDKLKIKKIFNKYNPDAIINLAAESHVDNSIKKPDNFIQTNIIGTYNLLNQAKEYIQSSQKQNLNFRFIHVSTDEVYGDLDFNEAPATELHPYLPSSPYSASKASSDHLVNSWNRTYNLPTIVTNCSNNYGPFQYPEKLIPLIIQNALRHKELPIYGDGSQVRDWIYVEDHAEALLTILKKGKSGNTYNIGSNNEIRNIDLVIGICDILDEIYPIQRNKFKTYKELIKYVEDRPGHDKRYSLNTSKINNEVGWKPSESFASGIRKTVEWYLKNFIDIL